MTSRLARRRAGGVVRGLATGGSDPDQELIARVGRGDPAAIQALVARKLPRMLQLGHRMLGDAAEA